MSCSSLKASTMGAPPRPTPRGNRAQATSSTDSTQSNPPSLYPRLPLSAYNAGQDRGRSREKHAGRSPAVTTSAHRMDAGGTPSHDPRNRRRSKSLTIDHQPKALVPGSTMEPHLGKSKRTTRPRSGDLAGATDYALTHQEVDSEGNVCTSLYKGDVHGTIAGGSAVVFKDVEQVSHRDPLRPLKRSSFEEFCQHIKEKNF